MMAIFFTKYATAVTLAMHPGASHNALLSTLVCALFGVFNGYFLGRLARNLLTWRSLRAPTMGGSYLTSAA
jgi:NhaP-type Na+/H+ or K+/H+ antiporter